MKFLVSGAGGFIGQHLVRHLDSCGYSTIPVVRNRMPDMNCNNVDAIIHLAGRAHVLDGEDSLDAYMDGNHHYTLHLANWAVSAKIKRFVYVSSIGVNGYKTDFGLTINENSPVNPYNYYTVSKRAAEVSLQELAKLTGLEIVIIRPPLVYGPHVKANFLSLLKWIKRGIPLPLRSADNMRSMIYIENLIDVLVLCAMHPCASGQTFVVCDNETISVADLIEKLTAMMKGRNRNFHFPIQLLNMLARLAGKKDAVQRLTQSLEIDASSIFDTLQWRPQFHIDEGLRCTVDWFLDEYQN